MVKINKEIISNAVKELEKHTSGELVPVLIEKSHNYKDAAWRFSVFFSIFLTYIIYLLDDYFPLYFYFIIQLFLILLGFILLKIPYLFRLVIYKKEMDDEVHHKAQEYFYNLGLMNTRDHTGILILVSVFERKVVILADSGINSKVKKDFWDEIVKNMLIKIKENKLEESFTNAIKDCESILEKNFPRKSDDTNELPDDLITS